MNNYLVYLLCDTGLTSSVILNKLNAIVSRDSLPFEIESAAAAMVDEMVNDRIPSLILLTPQVKFLKDRLSTTYKNKDIKVVAIPKKIYTSHNTKDIIDTIKTQLIN